MFGFLNFRVYAVIAVCTSAICAGIAYFDQAEGFANFFRTIATDARPFLGSNITDVIFEPLALVFSDMYWAIAAGVLWPALVLWFFFMLIGLGAAFIGPAFSEVNSL